MADEKSVRQLIQELEDDGMVMTDDPHEAIYIFPDGTMVDGEYDYGLRGLDHNCLISWFDGDVRRMHEESGVARLVPETACYLIAQGQVLSPKQEEILEKLGYEKEEY